MSTHAPPTDSQGFEYRDLAFAARARLANTDPTKYRAMKAHWDAAGRPSPRPITRAALVRAGLVHDGRTFGEMNSTQRAKLRLENSAKYESLKRQWVESGRRSDGPEAA